MILQSHPLIIPSLLLLHQHLNIFGDIYYNRVHGILCSEWVLCWGPMNCNGLTKVLVNELCWDLNTQHSDEMETSFRQWKLACSAWCLIKTEISDIKFVASGKHECFLSRSFRVIQGCYKLIFRATCVKSIWMFNLLLREW